jgi:phosphocarrier protein
MLEKTIKILNPHGIHPKNATILVQTANKFVSNIWISKDEKKVNAKSLMGVMSLAIPQGADIVVLAEGKDEDMAVNTIAELVSASE